jgi:hypothetical protein
MADYVFHVLHNARPEYELEIFHLLEDGQESSYEKLLQDGEQMGYAIGYQVKTERQLKDVLQVLRDLDLVDRRQVQLTDKGQTIAQLVYKKPELFTEMIHFLYYTSWQETNKPEKCFSWSYRTLCNYLWQQGSFVIDKPALSSLISSEASEAFQIHSVSFSPSSVTGITIWLEALNPPVILQDGSKSEDRFGRRTFCPPELLILSMDYIYRCADADYGSNLLLSETRRNMICQLCLLEPNSLERVMEYTLAQFDYLQTGIGGGWGQYISLQRQPKIEDFI